MQQVFKEANEKIWKIIKYLSQISTTIWQRYQCVRFKYLQILKSNIFEDIWPKYESDCCASPIHHSAKRLDFGQPVNRYILVDWLQYITITIYQDIVIWIHQPSWLIDLCSMMGADCLTRPDWTRWWLAWEKGFEKSQLWNINTCVHGHKQRQSYIMCPIDFFLRQEFVCEKKTPFLLCQQTYFGSFSLCYLIQITQILTHNTAIL